MRTRFLLAGAVWLAPGMFARPPRATVDIRTFQYSPDTLQVTAGTVVTWANRDEIAHTVTSGTPERREAPLALALPGKGESARHRFDRPGTYRYFCERHAFMRGTITVTR